MARPTTTALELPWREGDDDLLTVPEVCALLRVKRRTFYTIPFFTTRKVRVGARGVRVRRGAVRLYILLQEGAPAERAAGAA